MKKRAYTLVFDNLQSNVCDVMKGYFIKNTHGMKTRNSEISVNLPQTRTEFEGKEVYF